MAKEEKKSVLEEAVVEYKQLMEAAEYSAAKKLAEKMPDKFQELLKEEMNNNKNSDKEPYKKVNEKKESKNLDEAEDKNDKSAMKKVEKETKEVVKEERDKDFTGDSEKDTPNLGHGETEDGDNFVDDPTEKKESIANDTQLKEEFDVTELDLDNVEGALDDADEDDEIVTMDDIEAEINEMEKIVTGELEPESDPFDEKIGALKNQLQEMLNSLNEAEAGLEEQKKHGGKQNFKGRENGGPTEQMIEEEEVSEEEVDEQKKHGGKQNFKGRENGGPTEQMIEEEDEVEETYNIDHASSKSVTGDHLPGKEFAKHRHKRYGSVNNPEVNEATKKKITALLEQNKKLTKKINESKKYKESVGQLIEGYKKALQKYRGQLKEMAVFNTNLANVNNLLVNEELALTHEDKVKIINEFKEVNSITKSKEKYINLLENMSSKKENLSENVENKLNGSVGESSKKKLDEVHETTAYENDDHIKKIKKLIEYTERKDKKVL